jgi:hypothetical protein
MFQMENAGLSLEKRRTKSKHQVLNEEKLEEIGAGLEFW